MKFAQFSIPTLMGLVLLLPGCGAPHKQVMRKPTTPLHTVNFQQSKDGIVLKIVEIPKDELEKIIPKGKKRLNAANILPVQITVANLNTSAIRLSPFQKNIPFAPASKVRSALHGKRYYLVPIGIAVTAALTAATGICAVLYAGLSAIYGGISTLAMISIMTIPTGGVLLLGAGGSLLLHKKLDADYQKMSKAIRCSQCIFLQPQEEFKALLLLDMNNLNTPFDIHVHNTAQTKTTFTIPVI